MAGSTNEQQAESLFPREAEGGEKRGGGGRGGGGGIERGQSESVLKMGGRNKEGGGVGDEEKKTNKENK